MSNKMFKRSRQAVISPHKAASRYFRWFIEGMIVLIVVLGFRVWSQLSLISGDAPTFQTEMIGGEVVQLVDYRGEPVLLYFWATDCFSCHLQRSAISDLIQDHSVLTVVSARDSAAVEEYRREHHIDWPTIIDSTGALHRAYGVQAVPTHYIIDSEGIIKFREVGLTSYWGLWLRLWGAQ